MEDSVDIIIRMAELTKRSLREQISPEELVELKDWLAQSENHRRYLANLFSDESLQEYAWSSRTNTTVPEEANTETDKIRKGPAIIRRLIAWAALMAALGGVTYFLWWQSKGERLFDESGPMSTASTIEPGTNKAVLTLPNGQRLSLNNGQDTDLSLSNSVIHQRGGTIKYQSAPDPSRPEYHILSTPRGGQWHVELPDGSEVWLNAASSIKYPTSFLKNDREVEITGEAFFQVKSSPSAPFIVKAPHTTVTVLGTSFNVDAYSTDSTVETTLVNGAVKVSAAGKTRNLQPGTQAATTETDMIVRQANLDAVTAWKEGFFYYDQAPLISVMKDLENWYDVNVKFETGFNGMPHFSGKIDRNISLEKILSMISETKVATFKIEGRTVIVQEAK